MMMAGMSGWRRCSASKKSRPELPGMRISLTTTCGGLSFMPRKASPAVENLLTWMPWRARAFSSTQRMERSSSMIQTDFILFTFKPRKNDCPDELTSHLTKRGETCAKSLVNERHEKIQKLQARKLILNGWINKIMRLLVMSLLKLLGSWKLPKMLLIRNQTSRSI